MADWLGISSANLHSDCGDSGYPVEDALDATSYWYHTIGEVHWFIIDLGASYTISKLRAYSNSSFDPDDVDIYISDDAGSFGTAVHTNITTWQDTASYVEVEITPSSGRYIKVEVQSTEIGQILQWGQTASGRVGTIFDAYGELYVVSNIPSNTITYKRLVAVGNNKVYIEDI